MARDFEDIHDLDDLSDEELRDLVREQLASHQGLDIDEITVSVERGVVTLEGRVGTDQERRIAEHVVTDVIGLDSCENNIFVDASRRVESPEAADDSLAAEEAEDGLLLGDRPSQQTDEADHLADDIDQELYGTSDVQHAIADGTAWIPPESPTPEGVPGETELGELGENH